MKGVGDPELQTVWKLETSVGMRVKKGEVKLIGEGLSGGKMEIQEKSLIPAYSKEEKEKRRKVGADGTQQGEKWRASERGKEVPETVEESIFLDTTSNWISIFMSGG